ncbi:DUF397 domain-containing protein [Streptomyces sp. NBC_01387]|uniref:DUF397 domain-containing protein n=1 Tax=unclassified Streptomyces TaxID=2593676 RepID=UPI0022599154|nr:MULTISPECIES: DUF397 domain-containing protein [unclassified Streptomyces]MCX4550084.1 DUF397 domain-containing protein [Streptomyces sp. NBC_01500]WSC21580.1 DUF397 domain-containing protein [Streptomyces sp. NBC_01766]WSV55543.1 DUF397 domain-containing protein [Streptomyces sp. NBC_01014]
MKTSPEYDLSTATWHKSSYSGGEGGNCLEIATWHKSSYSGGSGGDCLEVATWRKSTHSGGDGGNCLEVSDDHPGVVPVRDSKTPDTPGLVFRAAAWAAFVEDVKSDR